MSTILDTDKVDGVGFEKGTERFMLLLFDHLDWSGDEIDQAEWEEGEKDNWHKEDWEGEHLLLLQDKINSYLNYIELEQYKQYLKERNIEREIDEFVIFICFKYEPTANCMKFLEIVGRQIEGLNTVIEFEVDNPDDDE